MLRPERIAARRRRGAGRRLNVLRARVTSVIYQGEAILLQAQLADGSAHQRARHRAGARWRLPARAPPCDLGSARRHGVAVRRGRRVNANARTRQSDEHAACTPARPARRQPAATHAAALRRDGRSSGCAVRALPAAAAGAVTMALPVGWLFGLSSSPMTARSASSITGGWSSSRRMRASSARPSRSACSPPRSASCSAIRSPMCCRSCRGASPTCA